MFNSPRVTFKKGNILGETAPEIIKNTKIAETSPEAPETSKVEVSSEKEFIPDMAPDGYIKTISINGEFSGTFALLDVGNEVRMSGSLGANTEIDQKHRGKGYGYKAYLLLAKQVKAEGKTLVSDSTRTEDATRVWNKLVKDGYATKVGKVYKINNSKITTAQQAKKKFKQGKKSKGIIDNLSNNCK